MPGMDELFSDPEIMKAMQSPKVMQAMMEMQTGGPAAMAKYASDPEILGLMMKIQSKMGGVCVYTFPLSLSLSLSLTLSLSLSPSLSVSVSVSLSVCVSLSLCLSLSLSLSLSLCLSLCLSLSLSLSLALLCKALGALSVVCSTC